MSKIDQLFGQLPVKVVLTGDTQADPRAHKALGVNATEIFRFYTHARDNAIRGGLPQQVRNAMLSNGIKARFVFNQGLETLLLYVPLSEQSGGSEEPPQEFPVGQRNLVIDVLMPCNPYAELAVQDGNHWTKLDAKARHACLWSLGATLDDPKKPADVTSTTPFGGSLGGNGMFDGSEILPTGVVDPTTLRTPPPLPTPYTMAHDPAEFDIEQAVPGVFNRKALGNSYAGPTSLDKMYDGYFGTSFLFWPKLAKTTNFTLYFAHANMYDKKSYTGGIPPTYSTGFGKQSVAGPIIIRCREYDKAVKILRIPVTTIEQKYVLHAEPTPPHDGQADVLTRDFIEGTHLHWHFFAGAAYKFNGGPPADKDASGMGDIIASSESISNKYKLGRTGGYNSPDAMFDVEGFSFVTAGYSWDGTAGPGATQIYETMAYTGNARDMTQLASINYQPKGSGRGSATVTFYTG